MPATFPLPSAPYSLRANTFTPLESPVLWTSPVVDDVSGVCSRQQPQPPQQPTSSSAAYSVDAESVWYMPGSRDSRLRDGNSCCWYRVPPNYLRPSPSLLPAYVPYLLYCHLVSLSRPWMLALAAPCLVTFLLRF
ncbi:hypothetical protein E4U57_006824 [Claviceps arundinis]|uniref:Uncharacterized protein n=1 Tax=Claviceps arundinis TaxID=1623583 RepID=A0A9P7SPQ9_9HYPO|nr:hypothetical protein E4U57_006824 [Claviceps arundinis]KAG5965306.1 hypothetical protein E4U56_001821 [Claviceps arundinis]